VGVKVVAMENETLPTSVKLPCNQNDIA